MKNLFAKIKENKSFIVPWLILGFAIIIFASGLTYAYFDFILASEDESSLRITGTDFDVYLTAPDLNLTDIVPIYDEYIDTQADTFDFEVENNSRRLVACYSLSLDITSISASLISPDFNWKLINTRTDEVMATDNFSGASTSVDIALVSNISLSSHVTDTYELKIWLSNTESNQNSTQETYFEATVKLNAVVGACNTTRVNTKLDDVRYVKDCVNGSNSTVNNHWVEIKTIYNGINVAYGKTATGTVAENATYPYSRITDGDITTTNYARAGSSGLQCITVDLTQTYDLDEITIWHYWGDGRTYYSNTTYVSSDNSTWIPVIANYQAETSTGKSVSVYDSNATVTPIFRVTNVLLDTTFVSGNTNWANVTATSSFAAGTASATSTAQYGGIRQIFSTDIRDSLKGHQVYGSAMLKANSTSVYWVAVNDGISQQTPLLTVIDTWQRLSATTLFSAVATGGYVKTQDARTASWAVHYMKEPILIDLTTAFGVGNEPTKAWCDSNLNYFDGSQNMYLSLD